MKKKIFILISFVFILCGCTAEVNLNVTKNRVEETVTINAYTNDLYTKEQLYSAFRKYVPVSGNVMIVDTEPDKKEVGIKYYDRTEKDLGNGYQFVYKYNFYFNDYKNATSIKKGFKSYTIQKDKIEKQVLLSTDSGGLLYFNDYPYLTSVKVNIKPDYEVIEHNADSLKDGVYTWNLTKNSKKGIYLLMNEEKLKEEENKEEENKNEENKTNEKEKEEYENDFEKFINEHPILVAIIALVIFMLFVIIISKLSKIKL